jgi:hypothetical protein
MKKKMTDAQVREKWERLYGGNYEMKEITEFNFKFYLVIATVISVLVFAHAFKYFP